MVNNMNKFYVYTLSSSLDNKIFYIGKGHGNRMYDHEKDVYKYFSTKKYPRSYNKKLMYKILKINKLGGHIIYDKIYENTDEDLTYIYEECIIDSMGLEALCNLTRGGKGGRKGYKHTTENAKKFKKILLEKAIPASIQSNTGKKKDPIKNKKQTDAARVTQKNILCRPDIRKKAAHTQTGQKRPKTSKALLGKSKSSTHRHNLSIAATARMKNQNQRDQISKSVSKSLIGNNRSAKSVTIDFLNGSMETFASQKEAAIALGITTTFISDLIKNPNKKRRKRITFKVIQTSELS